MKKCGYLFHLLLICLVTFGKPLQDNSNYIIHTVAFGETLSKISREYGVTVTDILNVNPALAEINNLSPGQLVRIPKKGKKPLPSSQPVPNVLQPKVINQPALVPK